MRIAKPLVIFSLEDFFFVYDFTHFIILCCFAGALERRRVKLQGRGDWNIVQLFKVV